MNARTSKRFMVAAIVAVAASAIFGTNATAIPRGEYEPSEPTEETTRTYSRPAPSTTPAPEPTPVPSPTPAPASDPIAFTASETPVMISRYNPATNSYDLFWQYPDGTTLAQLTNTPNDNELQPTWDRDVTRIAYVVTRYGHNTVYVMSGGGTAAAKPVNLSTNDFHPALSPDGRKIAFTRTGDDGRYSIYWGEIQPDDYTWNVFPLMKADTVGQYYQPAFSPDGTKIAFTARTEGKDNIFVKSLPNGAVVRMSYDGGHSPAWSPDGRVIVYTFPNPDGTSQVVYQELGYAEHPAFSVTRGSYDVNPTWSRDGTRIAFTRHGGGRIDVWVVNVDGSGARNMTAQNPSISFDPVWGVSG